uniref:C-type lectin domain-containing protein n=1 Tax=Amphilophus citrinellus TaxID=61819 RepID=A0A3Q0SUG2_AMPCI
MTVFITGWNDKCGSWTADPFNDYCYLFNYLSMRTWAEARADCVNQGGDLVSITDPSEQAFIQEGGGQNMCFKDWRYSWTDGTPLSHTNWGSGEPNDHEGREDCVEMLPSVAPTLAGGRTKTFVITTMTLT